MMTERSENFVDLYSEKQVNRFFFTEKIVIDEKFSIVITPST